MICLDRHSIPPVIAIVLGKGAHDLAALKFLPLKSLLGIMRAAIDPTACIPPAQRRTPARDLTKT
jgi:hypothetical protein